MMPNKKVILKRMTFLFSGAIINFRKGFYPRLRIYHPYSTVA